MLEFIIAVAAIGGGIVWYKSAQAKARRAALLVKYGDPEIVDRIMKGKYWQGQTVEQLRDSLGPPVDTDQKVTKTKTREIWKYHKTGTNRFGLRVTVENGAVSGWDEKL